MGFGVALVVGGSWWIYEFWLFSGGGFMGFCVLEMVVVCVWCNSVGDHGLLGFFLLL